jgi:hypothetical protein
MITSEKWDQIVFKHPRQRVNNTPITALLGFDSEAYKTGAPFMFCFSDGFYCKPKAVFQVLYDRYLGKHFAVYNLKYDSGAILFTIPKKNKIELWEKNETFYQAVNCHIEYIPHKHLRLSWETGEIKRGKPVMDSVYFWDISQYYNMSLDAAAERYLDRHKLDIETKKFTRLYVKDNFERIKKYCIQDSVLCADLGNYFLKKLDDAGIQPSALYSSAFLSLEYFQKKCNVITSWRFYRWYPDMMKTALDSYQGGKFEITARGRTYAYVYDIVSAYPHSISQLVDLSFAEIVKDKKYRKEAVYGYLRCHVSITDTVHLTAGIMLKNNRVCPIGSYYLTLTKKEYDYMLEIGCDVDILEGYWIIVQSKRYPYKETVQELFALKDKYKKSDVMQANTYKIMLNGFYGKLAQVIEKENKKGILEYKPGYAWNPMHASEITADTRLQVTRWQNIYKEKCLAVHTDSILLSEKLPESFLGNGLGDLKLECEGDTILIACGQYELINKKGAYKGIWPENGETWRDILTKAGRKSIIEFQYTKVESWIEAVSKGHFDKINLFQPDIKKINLNVDNKRLWPCKVTAQDLLTTGFLQQSDPPIYINTEIPSFWNIKPGRTYQGLFEKYSEIPAPKIL